MKGVILAGGTGSRLYPNTKVTNKHLLPVYNKPMIYYAIENLLKAGIDDILILPGKDHAGDFAKLLGSGREFNAKFSFIIQDFAGGVAYPIKLIKDFVGTDSFVYLLGDNVIDHNFYDDVMNFKGGAHIFCKEVHDPQRFGIAEVVNGNVVSLEEKPEKPKSNNAVIGAYIYDNKAFEYVDLLEPSARGELEITDLNKEYLKRGELKASFISGHWYDTGTHDSLAQAAYHLMEKERPVEAYKVDSKNAPKIAVGFILYQAQKYLPDFLESLKNQDYAHLDIYALNANGESSHEDVEYIKKHYPHIKIIDPGINTGFARGHNIMIREAIKDKATFYLALNFDMILEPGFISELLNTMVKSFRIASVTGKIKQWNFIGRTEYNDFGKTNFIDTTGLVITAEHRFYDRGQGDIDYGQFDKEEEIFGISGAAALYRLEALEDSCFIDDQGNKEYFDELMFMYKEDVDLAYRLRYAGYSSYYTPKAIAYHDRSVSGTGTSTLKIAKNRFAKSRQNKEWSWLHHHIILQKYFNKEMSASTKSATLWYELKTLVFLVLFEQYLLKQVKELYKLRKQVNARKQQVKKRGHMRDSIERWMNL